jgi:hypothetical protein
MDLKTEMEIIKRIERLEKFVFAKGKKSVQTSDKKFKGATGGLRLLIENGFFDKKKSFGEIKSQLSQKGYNYSNQAVQTPLNNLSKSGGLLVGFKEGGKKVYAKRR